MDNKEILEIITRIDTRLVRIETKMDSYETVRDKAEEALHISKKNEEDIKEAKVNNWKLWTSIIAIAGGMLADIIIKNF